MPTCKLCHCTKAVTDFYKNDKTCKICRCTKVRENRARHIDYYRAFDRARGYHNLEHNKARSKYPQQYKAQTAVGNALRDGRLVKGVCEVCGASQVHGHHDDYAKPLDVRWLCTSHHKEWHDQNGEALNKELK